MDAWAALNDALPWDNITVFESGVSGVKDAGDTADYLPTGVPGHDRWQAWEVWRRVVGAMAASAQVAGWHSWRPLPALGNWYGLGLRLDEQCTVTEGDDVPCADCGDEGGLTPFSARYAVQRRSWFAHQRLTTALRYVSHVRMLLPTTDEIERTSDTDMDAVVFELTGSVRDPDSVTTYRFGYLVFLDLWRDSADIELLVQSTTGAGVTILRVATCTGDPVDGSSATANLPYGTPSFTDSYTKWVPSTGLTVPVGRNPPRLFLSNTRLDWSISPFSDVPHHGVPGAEEA